MSTTARRRTALVAMLVALAIVGVWALLPDDRPDPRKPDAVPAQAVVAGSALQSKPCYRGADGEFVPTRITVPGVTRDATVLALPRDANNVPQAPPISSAGKTQFAVDVAPSPMPGSPRGNVLLNAHTWPDGTALGNKLLAGLHVGGRIIVHGKVDGKPQKLCYEVTKRDVIIAEHGSWEYYERNGPPQLALIVCSPPRLGPGHWQNRTIWYASPLG